MNSSATYSTAHKGFRSFAKRAIAVILVMLMLSAFVPTTAFAAESHSHTSDKVISASNGSLVINGSMQNANILPSGNYYLTDNVTLDGLKIADNAEVTLCLNGKTLKVVVNAINKDNFVAVGSGAKFTVDCCKGSGVLTSTSTRTIHILNGSNEAEVIVKGGTITTEAGSSDSDLYPGVISVRAVNAKVTVEGGAIVAPSGSGIPGIAHDTRCMEIRVTGGSVVGDTAGIYSSNNSNAYNVVVRGGTVEGRKDYAIYNSNGNNKERIMIYGGTIKSGAKEALCTNGTVNLAGDPQFISGAPTGAQIRVTYKPIEAYDDSVSQVRYTGDAIRISSRAIEDLYNPNEYKSGSAAGTVLVKEVTDDNASSFLIPDPTDPDTAAYDIYEYERSGSDIKVKQYAAFVWFNANGTYVTNMPAEKYVCVNFGDIVSVLTTPSRNNYEFSHWCTDADCVTYKDCTNAWKSTDPVTGNMQLSAIWKPYTVVIEPDGDDFKAVASPAAESYQWYEITKELKEEHFLKDETRYTINEKALEIYTPIYETKNFDDAGNWSAVEKDITTLDYSYLEIWSAIEGRYVAKANAAFPDGYKPALVDVNNANYILYPEESGNTYTWDVESEEMPNGNRLALVVKDAYLSGKEPGELPTIKMYYHEQSDVTKEIEGATSAVLGSDKIESGIQYIVTAGFSNGSEVTSAPAKRVDSVSYSVYDRTYTYDGQPHSIDVVVPSGAIVKYGTSADNCVSDTKPTYTTVGKYTVYCAISVPFAKKITTSAYVEIVAAKPEIDAEGKNLSFTGASQSLISFSTEANGTAEYALGTDAASAPVSGWSTSIPTGTNVGTYYVWYKFTASDSNYENIAPKCLTVKINPASVDASEVSFDKAEFTYNGSAQKPNVTYAGITLAEGTDYTATWPEDCANAGDKTVTINFKGNFSGSAEKTYKILPKELGISWGRTEFTYNGNAQKPAATATGTVNGDQITLTVDGAQTDASDTAYTATVTNFDGDNAANYKLPGNVTASFTIGKADQSAPIVGKTDETISKKNDGKLTGLTADMEYRKDDETIYTAITDSTVENLAAGKYYVRVKGDDNHNPSPETTVVIAAGRKLKINVPQDQAGYTLSSSASEVDYLGQTVLTFALKEGYSKGDNFAVALNGNTDAQWADDTLTLEGIDTDIDIVVTGVVDVTAPTAEISVENNKWATFLNNITFGLFFNKTQDVTIAATDKGSGVNTVAYYLADGETELDKDEVMGIADWELYNGTFKVDPDKKYVIYAKVTDNAGNTEYINSDGLVIDATAPVAGIENNGIYYGEKTFSIADTLSGIAEIKVDGSIVTLTDGTYTIDADNAEHTVAITDNAGNVAEYKISVNKTYTVTFWVDGEKKEEQTVGYGNNAVLPEIPAKEGYNETAPTWDHDGRNITADTEINAVYTKNDPGEFRDATPESNVGGGKLADSIGKLKEAVPFTDEELWDIEHGTDVAIWLEIKDISSEVSETEKALIEQKLGEHTVGMYLDICLFKQVGQEQAVKLSNLNDHVTVSIKLPENMLNHNSDVVRTYKIIRIHDGAAEALDTVFDQNTDIISVETDRFSTYALTYIDDPIKDDPTEDEDDPIKDEPTEDEDDPIKDEPTEDKDDPIKDDPTEDEDDPIKDDPTEDEDDPIEDDQTEGEPNKDELPDTGDSGNLWLWVAIFTLSGISLSGIILAQLKRRSSKKR